MELDHFGNSKASADAKVNELNKLAGYKRFSVVETPLPGRGGSTLRNSWSVFDKKTGRTYTYGSIHGTFSLVGLINELRKKKADAVSYASPKKRSLRHDDFYEKPSLEDLEHYGVLGMKWGVRKDPKRAYSKATKKLEKLDISATKAGNKAVKSQRESVRRQQRASSAILLKKAKFRSAARSIRRTNRRYLSAQRKVDRAKRWYDAMDSTFKSTKISSLDPSKTELGKKYANMKLTDAMSSATTAASMAQLISYYEQKGRK